jgi:hypothetical protein
MPSACVYVSECERVCGNVCLHMLCKRECGWHTAIAPTNHPLIFPLRFLNLCTRAHARTLTHTQHTNCIYCCLRIKIIMIQLHAIWFLEPQYLAPAHTQNTHTHWIHSVHTHNTQTHIECMRTLTHRENTHTTHKHNAYTHLHTGRTHTHTTHTHSAYTLLHTGEHTHIMHTQTYTHGMHRLTHTA